MRDVVEAVSWLWFHQELGAGNLSAENNGIETARIMTAVEKTSRPPRPKLVVPPEVKEQLKRLNPAAEALDNLRAALERVPTPITVSTAKTILGVLNPEEISRAY